MVETQFSVAVAQVSPRLGDVAANLALYEERVAAAHGRGADLLVFPELSLTGYFLKDMVSTVVLRLDAPEVRTLKELSRRVAGARLAKAHYYEDDLIGTDEQELGFGYQDVDALLYLMVDLRYARSELHAAGFAASFVQRVSDMIRDSQFKRRLPVIAKVSNRTIDRDFRYARDWGR